MSLRREHALSVRTPTTACCPHCKRGVYVEYGHACAERDAAEAAAVAAAEAEKVEGKT